MRHGYSIYYLGYSRLKKTLWRDGVRNARLLITGGNICEFPHIQPATILTLFLPKNWSRKQNAQMVLKNTRNRANSNHTSQLCNDLAYETNKKTYDLKNLAIPAVSSPCLVLQVKHASRKRKLQDIEKSSIAQRLD
jgi:hypothetical protein